MQLICDELATLCRRRQQVMRRQRCINQPGEQEFSRGIQSIMPDATQKQRYARAGLVRDLMIELQQKGKIPDQCFGDDQEAALQAFRKAVNGLKKHELHPVEVELAFALLLFIKTDAFVLGIYDAHRKEIEKAIKACAQELPVFDWWDSIRGCAALGLGLIIGETGNLSKYSNPSKVWKRMGLAPVNGKACSTWRRAGGSGLKKEEWTNAGYSPRRRSVLFTVGDPLIKMGREYRQFYLDEKTRTETTHPDWWEDCPKCKGVAGKKSCEKCKGRGKSSNHAHRHAQRLMEKRLILNLWIEWNKGGNLQTCGAGQEGHDDHVECA